MHDNISSGRGVMFMLFAIMVLSPMSPLADVIVEPAEASGVARHVYEFADGSTEYVALYQGGNPDAGAEIALPRGAKITDVTMTLSGASATGWSQILDDDRSDWMAGQASSSDARSGDLSLAFENTTEAFFSHGYDEITDPNSDAWLDNGSYALRQPHTSNATESRFSQQTLKTSAALMKQSREPFFNTTIGCSCPLGVHRISTTSSSGCTRITSRGNPLCTSMKALATSISFIQAPTTVRMDSEIGRSLTMNECLRFCQDTATITVLLPRHNITVLWKWIFLETTLGFASIPMMYLHNIRTTLHCL